MKTITIEVQDEKMEEFIEKLEKFKQENCELDESCILINNLSIEDFKKHYVIDSE